MNKLSEYEIVLLSALLHDIGKFWQRTGEKTSDYEEFDKEDYGAHGAHSKWSSSFIENFLPVEFKDAITPILYHHNPQDHLSKLIQEADHLSAVERIESIITGDTQKIRLNPILGRIYLNADNSTRTSWQEKGFPITPFNYAYESNFPTLPGIDKDLTSEYLKSWHSFTNEVSSLKKNNLSFPSYFTTLYYLLQKYTWCIPSAVYKSEPDISLFDHLKSTTAIASVIYKSGGSNKFQIIGGDLSGIQKYLYQLSSPDEAQGGMAKRLRGRSFYLSLLNETIATYLLKELDLPITNLLWCGGGRFTILSYPNDILPSIYEKINQLLLEKHHGEPALILASIEVDNEGIRNFSNSMNLLNFELQKSKNQKYLNLPWPPPFELSKDICPICGKDTLESPCQDCLKDEEVGERIPHSQYLLKNSAPSTDDGNSVQINFSDFQTFWKLTNTLDHATKETEIIYKLNDTEFLNHSKNNISSAYKLIASKVPRDKDNRKISTFDSMQNMSKGAKFLGALRMDMDNLGSIFSFGLGENHSLSRVSSLSRSIDYFFSGYLNTICDEFPSIYILYSGGDDLFIVGSWNETIKVARKIYKKLAEYSGNNPDISISGGIHLFKHKYPIGMVADISKEKLEDKSKKHSHNGKNKNALTVFEFTASWEDVDKALKFAETLEKKIESGILSHNFISNILQIYKTYYLEKPSGMVWLSKFLYHLKRNVGETKTSEENFYKELQTKMPEMIRLTPLWANYVLLATRKNE